MAYKQDSPGMSTILIDLDDVLTWFVPAWLKWLNEKYGCNVKYEEVVDWDFRYLYPNLTSHQLHEPLGLPEFWKSVEVREDAKFYVKQLYDMGFNIYVCTATYYKDIAIKYETIIKKHFPYIDWNHVIVAKNKQMIKADYLIDDHVPNLIDGEYQKILLVVPRNDNFDPAETGIIKCGNWSDIYDTIQACESRQQPMLLPF